ncbi:PQQ-binding-like beta-propeller repeat protein [Sulfobacillus acidophilus]|uniref:PQQ-binding-like beta-propeller repeat protein n=1 Tax=Sulfobacillus acidophilus TaxID=53633 RepID=A0ABS3AV91_9FIRM|nr:PQQ-binding-like beta-propeller repeat protein [Sulfobacillus acidophilus]
MIRILACLVILSTGLFGYANKNELKPFHIKWIVPIAKKIPCLESIIKAPNTVQGCIPWDLKERVGVAYDALAGLVYTGGSDGKLHVFYAENGKLKTSISLDGKLIARPIIDKEQMYLGTSQGFLLSVNLKDLSFAWKTRLDSEIQESFTLNNNTLYVVTGLLTIYAIDSKNGAIKWVKKRGSPSGLFLRKLSSPLLYNGILAIGSPFGYLEFYDAGFGNIINRIMVSNATEPFLDVAATPVLSGANVIAASFNKGIVALNSKSAAQEWLVQELEISQLLAYEDTVFAAGAKKIIALDGKSGKILWRFLFDTGSPTMLLVKDGMLIFGSDKDSLFVLDRQSGKPLEYIGSNLGFSSDIVIYKENLFTVSSVGYLYRLSTDFKGRVHKEH